MKYAIFVLSLLVSFAVSADPRCSNNNDNNQGVHWPKSNIYAGAENKCINCAFDLVKRQGNVKHSCYAEGIVRMPKVQCGNVTAEPINSRNADFGCNLVDGDTTTVDHWKVKYEILSQDIESCEVYRRLICSGNELEVYVPGS